MREIKDKADKSEEMVEKKKKPGKLNLFHILG